MISNKNNKLERSIDRSRRQASTPGEAETVSLPVSGSEKTGAAGGRRRLGTETQQAFIQVATRLFAERGYNGTSIADIASELGLTTASLYYHVSGKQELLLKVLAEGMAAFLQRLEEIAARDIDPRQKLRLAVETHLSFVLSRTSAVAVFLRERRFLKSPYREEYQERVERYDRLFTDVISEAMAQGAIPDGDPRLIRLAILGMINWAVEWYKPDGRLTAAEIGSSFSELIIDRMLASPRDSSEH